jgi:hypothetical protein
LYKLDTLPLKEKNFVSIVLYLIHVFMMSYVWLWKESLNSDGQQFHRYKQNEQAPLTSNHWTYKIKFKQWWSTIQPISTKRTSTSHLKPLSVKRPRHMWRWKSRFWLRNGTFVEIFYICIYSISLPIRVFKTTSGVMVSVLTSQWL